MAARSGFNHKAGCRSCVHSEPRGAVPDDPPFRFFFLLMPSPGPLPTPVEALPLLASPSPLPPSPAPTPSSTEAAAARAAAASNAVASAATTAAGAVAPGRAFKKYCADDEREYNTTKKGSKQSSQVKSSFYSPNFMEQTAHCDHKPRGDV